MKRSSAGDQARPEGSMATWRPELLPSTVAILPGSEISSQGDARQALNRITTQITARIGTDGEIRGTKDFSATVPLEHLTERLTDDV
jgi:hypothetical protein